MNAGKDSASALGEVRSIIERKPALKRLYLEIYARYRAALERCPKEGAVLELGSGAGFVKDCIPETVTSDVVAGHGIDRVVDATRMPFANGELRAIFLLNVFHHIPDVGAFLREAERCLRPGGRILIVDQHVGPVSRLIFRYAHDEPFDPAAKEWAFQSTGRLSGANGALAWMVFRRDRECFAREFPGLKILSYRPHTAFRYWLCGGLKSWSLLPGWAFGLATALDNGTAALLPGMCSFVDVEIERA